MASAPALGSGLSSPASDAGTPAERAAASIAMRLQHDLRRLKEIQSIARRIDVKREMLPAYTDWVAGLLDGGRNAGAGIAEDVLPTVMVWLIDTGDYARALLLAEHVIAYDVPLPSRYERSAAALIVEEIADAAIRAQTAKAPFPLDVLEHVAELTADADMHDQVRAKLHKAIGTELARAADAIDPAKPEFAALAQRALDPLRRAVALHDRVGVAGQIKRLERALAPPKPTTKSAGTVPAT
ncbi:phage terminase small subunit [Sphingomonas sp. CFBP 8765]|uniref:phage terminase small subunit n=1 Tax=Sphingomonas sp. CFBP 8765 TaxID=2775274 RepID=UPI002017B16E|nr:phage terminase small subunit [Sphingomonas sp. CFBP 8765]